MQKAKMFVLLGMTFLITAVTFNNCGKVEFQKMSDVDGKVLSSSPSGVEDEAGVPVTDEQIQQIIADIPADELAIIRPVTDLQDPNNEFLFDVYSCGDGSVLICHFPATVIGSEACIGRSAVKSHYDHTRLYDNDTKSISDYLGPCRVAL
jgi:hypothetical protein